MERQKAAGASEAGLDGRESGGAAFRSSGSGVGGAEGVCAQRWRPFPPVTNVRGTR